MLRETRVLASSTGVPLTTNSQRPNPPPTRLPDSAPSTTSTATPQYRSGGAVDIENTVRNGPRRQVSSRTHQVIIGTFDGKGIDVPYHSDPFHRFQGDEVFDERFDGLRWEGMISAQSQNQSSTRQQPLTFLHSSFITIL